MLLRSGKRTRSPTIPVAQRRGTANLLPRTLFVETGLRHRIFAAFQRTTDICVFCQDIKRSPVEVKCGHSFCKECLAQHTVLSDQHPWSMLCPICRRIIEPKTCNLQDYRYWKLGIWYMAIVAFGCGIVMAVYCYIF